MPATYVLLSHTVTSGSPSVVTISSIPSTYQTLVLKCAVRFNLAATLDTIAVRFNNDNLGSTYYSSGGGRNHTASSNYFYQNLQSVLNLNSASGDNLAAGTVGFFEMAIINANTSQVKTTVARGGVTNSSFTNATNYLYGGVWVGDAAINSLNVRSSSTGPFMDGSTISLYGLSNT